MALDARKAFVLNTIASAIASSDQRDAYVQYLAQDANGALASFLEDARTTVLVASVSGFGSSQLKLQLATDASFPEDCEYQVILAKLRPGPVAVDDVPANISVSTVSHSPLSSLYHCLKDVYHPLLLAHQQGANGEAASKDHKDQVSFIEPRLLELLQQVEAGLGAAVRKGQASPASAASDPNTAPLHEVLTPLDEVAYWEELATSGAAAGSAAQPAAQQVHTHMCVLRAPYEALLSAAIRGLGHAGGADGDAGLEGGWEAVKETLDQTISVLRAVWPVRLPGAGGFAFSQKRVENLLHVTAAAIAAYVQSQLHGVDLWARPFAEIKGSLIGASQVMARLASEFRLLSQDWAMGIDNGGHSWNGPPLSDPYVLAFQQRLEEVYTMRETHDELCRLLGQNEAQSLGAAEVFTPLLHLPVLQVSEYNMPAWRSGKEDFERRMEPLEQRISQKLRDLFGSTIIPALIVAVTGDAAVQPQQVFQDLRRYGSLLSRPAVAAALASEKEALAKQVDKHIDALQGALDERQAAADAGSKNADGLGRNPSNVVDRIMWALKTQHKLAKTQEVLRLMLGNKDMAAVGGDASTSSLQNCLSVASQLSKEVDAFKKQQFEAWEDETQEQLESMANWKNSKLMTFDSHNLHVKTHFNDQLVVLLREVRQLQSLGFNIKRPILLEVETANRFYRYGMVLKQRANFYNNISTEMIPCQKPMLLQDAMDFEKVLMNPKDAQGKEITWKNAAALEGYVKRLNAVAERLAEKNRQLRKWHDVLRDKVITLMGTDLVRHKDRWAMGVKEMRDIFLRLENEGYSRDMQQVWRQHWDFQLYKALDYQYQQGITCINQSLPEIDIKMVFRQHKLQYDPPLEDVRIKHYKDNLNTFLGLPLRMKGVSDLSERPGFFRPIVDSAPQGIAKVYAAAEALFGQLADELKKYQDWMVLGTVDLDEFVDENLTEVSDWELNFKVLKAAARDAEKLPNEVKVDCYTISMVPVKTVVDEQMKRLQETLVASLRRKAVAEKEEIEEYIRNGHGLFGRQAASVEEIGVAGQEARTMVAGLSNVQQTKRRIDEKNKLLRAMAAGGTGKDAAFAVVDLTDVNNAWETFTTQLQQFDASLEDQKQQLGVAVGKQLDDFRGTVAGFSSRWEELKPKGGPSGNPAIALNRIQEYAAEVQELREESAKLQKEAEAFKLDVGGFEILDQVATDVDNTAKSWNRYAEFLNERNEMANKEWLSMREQVWKIEDFLAKWSGGNEGAKDVNDPITAILSKEIKSYQQCLPHLKTTMRGAGWEDTHWLQLFKMLGLNTSGEKGVSRETVTLAHFLDVADKVVSCADSIKALDAQAQGEAMIRKALAELKLWGQNREFTFSDPITAPGRRRIVLIKEWRDVQAEVGDNQSLVASLRQSSYYHLFKDEVANWEQKLSILQEGLMLLNQIQRKWVYLEPIFSRGALPAQQARFRNVDEEFRRVMYQLENNKLVVSFADIMGIQEKLPQMAQQLDVCQRALSDFLEDKRLSFPRFYFLGDDDLLEILGQAQNPAVIQSHLKKLFAGIHKVKFSGDHSSITNMNSMEGEVVELTGGVRVTDSIESWLNSLATTMRSVMANQLELVCAGQMREEFKAAASQTLCLKEAVSFTDMVEKALRQPNGIQRVAKDMTTALEQLASADYTGSTLLQLKKQALVLDFIHYLDVVDQLIQEHTSSPAEWAWTRQLRYYRVQGGVDVCMAEASFQYTWEYQGNAPKLVYTPLTDKCYLTLTQGMALGYGGNPYGPAGTGKTESVKALGQALARQVLVFNCDEEFDFRAMGRIFVGLVKCGAWGCFDEFNRLDEEVLSAVSQQIQIIQGALKEGAATMDFMDKTVEVDKNAGIFVTMNPAGKGYGGRSKLPDNLKQLFRSIAMTVPNNEQIAEVLLVSEGFKHAKMLARKLVTLFSLSRELLSQQQHYDWGLRALKTALAIAGRELREARKAAGSAAKPLSEAEEMEIIVRAVCATKLPTLTFEDNRSFVALINDLFTGVKITDSRNPDLEAAIKTVSASMRIELTQPQVDKILQLHLACEQRIGIIIVGPSGSGKSTLWEVLEKAYEQLGKRPVVYRMNPKAMARQQLLGSMNLDTREWSDGVLTAAARKVVKEPLEQRSWIVCDGDVDPEWIESLNSVLDDNRLLTMPNGERIQFANNVNFIFECHSLEFASPATVSRCGMLYMSDEALDVRSLVSKWLVDHTSEAERGQMETWIKDYFYRAYEWGLNRPSAVETTKVGLLSSALSHLAAEGAGSKHDFVVALARGVGANMTPEVRADFYSDLGRMTGEGGFAEDQGAYGADPLLCLGDELRERGVGSGEGNNIDLVLTPDMHASMALIAPWLKSREPFVLVGPDGCGKSTLLQHCFSRIVGCSVATVHCSAQTNAANVVQKLVQVCGKPVTTAIGKCLRPPDNARIILFLKDINLPRPDKYNTSQLIAFLQQLLSHGGYYDENLDFIHVQRVQIIGSMSPPQTVGRYPLSTRFTARVRVACLAYPDVSSLQSVYTSIITQVLPSTGGANPSYLAKAMLEVYSQVTDRFTVNEQAHYTFNPRDITCWVQGLKRYIIDPSSMSLADAFGHEACRIFRDRLVGQEALDTFDAGLATVMSTNLGSRGSLAGWMATTLGCTYEDRMSKTLQSTRLARWGLEHLQELVGSKLKSYEREIKELHMLLFPEVLERIARFDRVLAEPGGSLLLCGPSGTGRRTCMLLLAYMHQLHFFSPKMNRAYDLKSFRSDLKEVLKTTGVEGKPTLLFLEDHQLVEPSFLEMVNSLLSGGEVPGLFTNEELNKDLAPLEQAKNEDQTYTGPNNTYVYFTHRVCQNLHIAISMDPSNDLFRPRCEANPALLTRCSVQWLDEWNDTTKSHISRVRLQEALCGDKGKQTIADSDLANLVSSMVLVHNSMRAIGATPRQFMAFVQLYKSIFAEKRKEVLEQQGFLKSGLTKLAEAERTVDELSANAGVQRELLKSKQAEAEEALVRIQSSMMQAADRRKEVEILKKRQAVEEVEMQARRGGVEEELKGVQPLVDQARKSVGSIKKENIDEIRSLKMPPDAIRDVLEGVLLVLGQQDTSWNNMKKFLGAKAVKDDIVNFDARKVSPNLRNTVGSLIARKGNSFEPAVIQRVSVAAAPLAAWVKAIMAFSKVLEKTAPLEAELSGLVRSLQESAGLIQQYEQELVSCDEQVNFLRNDFAKRTSEAESLRTRVEKEEATVNVARDLLGKLTGEKQRWSSQVQALNASLQSAPIDALMTSAFITYLPGHSEDVRTRVEKAWMLQLGVQDYNFCRFMSSESEMLRWKGEGLPADNLSMQNAVVILNSCQPPLVIDPSTQASKWLEHHLRGKCPTLEVTNMHDPRFANTLELAVRFGKTLIVQEVDRIEGILYPLLRHDLARQGPRFVVDVGDKQIDYNETFRLYMVTRHPEPYLPPDARSLVSTTNFTVTRSGLEGQLLGLTLQQEQPELEEKKSKLLQQEEDLKVQLADLEKHLLHTLANSKGSLLENKELLDSLNASQSKSQTVAAGLTHSRDLQASLDEQREVYRPIAQRGSTMYFLIKDLATINHMYRFSLSIFTSLFKRALNQDTPAGDITARITLLSGALLNLVLSYVARSLFHADRLMLGMHMARHMKPAAVKPEEWDFFLGKPHVDASPAQVPRPPWVAEASAGAYALLAANFPQLVQACDLTNGQLWGPWVSGDAGGDGSIALPGSVASKATPFQVLLLVQTFRADRLQAAMSSFVSSTLNVKGVTPLPFSLKDLVERESNASQPVLFTTTPGADPTVELSEFAAATVGKNRYHEVAMGQGQADIALALLRDCARSGDWLCLKNLHLAVSWLPTLEKEMYTLSKVDSFRLFLSTEPHPRFPTTLLEGALKITVEAPPGVKKNLQRTYETWTQPLLTAGPPLRAQLMFVLAWFHAVVQERRSYIPQGWSKFYEFSTADLRSGVDVIGMALKAGEGNCQWKLLHGLLENAIYGGRVDNKLDGKVLRAYLHQYFSPEIVGQGGRVKPLPGSRIAVPTTTHRDDYLQSIGSLPDADSPSLFSLPANIGRAAQQVHGQKVVQSLKTMSLASTTTTAFNSAQWSAQLGPLLRLWETLTTQAAPLKVAAKEIAAAKRDKNMAATPSSPVDAFVALERAHAVKVVEAVGATLTAINRVLRGQATLSSGVRASGQQLLIDEVPSSWESLWDEGPKAPSDFVRAVVRRGLAIEQNWWAKAQAGSLLTSGPLDLSQLFHPGPFLNALRQQTARANKVPLDHLKLGTCWDVSRLGSQAIQVGGLLIQGATFDGSRLGPLSQDSPISRAVPPMGLAWLPYESPLPYASHISTPLYSTQDRTHVLIEVQLPVSSAEEEVANTLAGLALFMSA